MSDMEMNVTDSASFAQPAAWTTACSALTQLVTYSDYYGIDGNVRQGLDGTLAGVRSDYIGPTRCDPNTATDTPSLDQCRNCKATLWHLYNALSATDMLKPENSSVDKRKYVGEALAAIFALQRTQHSERSTIIIDPAVSQIHNPWAVVKLTDIDDKAQYGSLFTNQYYRYIPVFEDKVGNNALYQTCGVGTHDVVETHMDCRKCTRVVLGYLSEMAIKYSKVARNQQDMESTWLVSTSMYMNAAHAKFHPGQYQHPQQVQYANERVYTYSQ